MKDLTKLFPQIRPAAESIIELTPHRLRYDEVQIVERLIARYGEDEPLKMTKDTKLNYLQWSKGQCAKMVSIYQDMKSRNKI